MPVDVSDAVYAALENVNSEVKITLIASPRSRELPAEGDTDMEPINFKVETIHVDAVRTNT